MYVIYCICVPMLNSTVFVYLLNIFMCMKHHFVSRTPKELDIYKQTSYCSFDLYSSFFLTLQQLT